MAAVVVEDAAALRAVEDAVALRMADDAVALRMADDEIEDFEAHANGVCLVKWAR